MKFRYFLGFSVSSELTLGHYCLERANSSSHFFNAIKQDIHKLNKQTNSRKTQDFIRKFMEGTIFSYVTSILLFLFAIQSSDTLIQLSILKYCNMLGIVLEYFFFLIVLEYFNPCFSRWAMSPPWGRKRNTRGRKGEIAHSWNINPFSKY